MILNFTPHEVRLNNGTSFPSIGVARVSATFDKVDGLLYRQTFGDIIGLPEPKNGTYYIVSAIVLSAAKAVGRTDCISPATGHPDCIRENGFIKSVPGFVL